MSASSDDSALFDRLPQSIRDSMFIPTLEQRARMESLPFATWKEDQMPDDNLPDVAETIGELHMWADRESEELGDNAYSVVTLREAASLLESLSARVTQAETEGMRKVLVWLDEHLNAEELDMAAEHLGVEVEWSEAPIAEEASNG